MATSCRLPVPYILWNPTKTPWNLNETHSLTEHYFPADILATKCFWPKLSIKFKFHLDKFTGGSFKAVLRLPWSLFWPGSHLTQSKPVMYSCLWGFLPPVYLKTKSSGVSWTGTLSGEVPHLFRLLIVGRLNLVTKQGTDSSEHL